MLRITPRLFSPNTSFPHSQSPPRRMSDMFPVSASVAPIVPGFISVISPASCSSGWCVCPNSTRSAATASPFRLMNAAPSSRRTNARASYTRAFLQMSAAAPRARRARNPYSPPPRAGDFGEQPRELLRVLEMIAQVQHGVPALRAGRLGHGVDFLVGVRKYQYFIAKQILLYSLAAYASCNGPSRA